MFFSQKKDFKKRNEFVPEWPDFPDDKLLEE
jgi:hypothetical protein